METSKLTDRKEMDGTTSMPTWTGEIGEIIAVGTTSERAKIEGYLAHKWVYLIPTNFSSYKSSQPSGNGSTSSDVLVSGACVYQAFRIWCDLHPNLKPHTNPS